MESIVITKLRGKPKDWDKRVKGYVVPPQSKVVVIASAVYDDAKHTLSRPMDFDRITSHILMWTINFTALHVLYKYLAR